MPKCNCACKCRRKDEYTEDGGTCEFCFREHTYEGEEGIYYPMSREQIKELSNA